MEILNSDQMRQADRFTIDHLPISPVDLMEKAASACFNWFTRHIGLESNLVIVCGRGNNGGDGLALARMLYGAGYQAEVYMLEGDSPLSPDCQLNLKRFQAIDGTLFKRVALKNDFPVNRKGMVVIDALFGTGLSRPADGLAAELISFINQLGCPIISIDLPSGIDSNRSSLSFGNKIIKATHTLTFQYLKPALVVEENAPFYGTVTVLDIGLIPESTNELGVDWYMTDRKTIAAIYKPKREFSHKGNFGHSMLITGGVGKMGAAILAAGGYLRSGAGLLTVVVPDDELRIIQTSTPEAMAACWSSCPDPETFTVTGIGPGMGTGPAAFAVVDQLLRQSVTPLVLDADALNILSLRKEWISRLPEGSVLTPHPGEFRRLAGDWNNDFEKLEFQRRFATTNRVYLVLKGKNTSIAGPDGRLWFNPTGNAGMAKGGSGDVLTGIITGLLACGYSPWNACLLGTWLHGLAGDLAAAELTQEGMNAGDIIRYLPNAWKEIIRYHT